MSGNRPKRSARVRPVSRDSGQPRIRGLRSFQEVYDRILDGWPLSEVARFIQEVKKEAVDMTRPGLVAALTDFRNTIPPAELTKKRLTQKYIKAAQEVEEGVDELKELEKLYRLQMQRVEIDFTHEKNIKKLMPTTGQEVRIAKEILSTYADLKMDLGLSKRHLGQVDVDARLMHDVALRYNKAEVQEVMDNAQSRKKVLGLVERLLSRPTATLATPADSPPDVIDVEAEPVVEREELFPEDLSDPLAEPIIASESDT